MARVNCLYCDGVGRIHKDACYRNCPYCSGCGYVETIDIQGTVAKMCLALQNGLEIKHDD